MLVRFTAISALLLGCTIAAGAGAVRTRDGRTLTGSLGIRGTEITVIGVDAAPVTVPLADINSAVFAEPAQVAAPIVHSRPVQTQRQRPPAQGNLKAEFFADREMKDLRLTRRDGVIDFTWPQGATPDPLVPEDFTARWTGQLNVPGFGHDTYPNALLLTLDGGARLWLDGKLVLDTWEKPRSGEETEIAFEAGRAHEFRLEYYPAVRPGIARVSRWSINRGRKKLVYAGYFLPPQGDRAVSPQLVLRSPEDGAGVLAPASVVLEAEPLATGKSISLVRFYDGARLVGTASSLPYRVSVDAPAAGAHVYTAQATDRDGLSATSPPTILHIADTAGGVLPAPWGSVTLGNASPSTHVGFSSGELAITHAGGELHADATADAFHFVYQSIEGDFDVITRLARLDCAGADDVYAAGLLVQTDFRPDAPRCGLMAGKETATDLFRAKTSQSLASTADAKIQAPVKLRMVRHEQELRTFVAATDGIWRPVASHRVEWPDRVYVGFAAATRDAGVPMSAVFDGIAIHVGAPVFASQTAGVLFTSGTFLAEDLLPATGMTLDDDAAMIRLPGRPKSEAVPRAQLARLMYKPLPAEMLQSAPVDRPGLLLGHGDFLESSRISLRNGEVHADSVLFGDRSFKTRGELIGILLAPERAAPSAFVVTTRGGSRLLARSLAGDGDRLIVEEPMLGSVTIPQNAICEIRAATQTKP